MCSGFPAAAGSSTASGRRAAERRDQVAIGIGGSRSRVSQSAAVPVAPIAIKRSQASPSERSGVVPDAAAIEDTLPSLRHEGTQAREVRLAGRVGWADADEVARRAHRHEQLRTLRMTLEHTQNDRLGRRRGDGRSRGYGARVRVVFQRGVQRMACRGTQIGRKRRRLGLSGRGSRRERSCAPRSARAAGLSASRCAEGARVGSTGKSMGIQHEIGPVCKQSRRAVASPRRSVRNCLQSKR